MYLLGGESASAAGSWRTPSAIWSRWRTAPAVRENMGAMRRLRRGSALEGVRRGLGWRATTPDATAMSNVI